jgi:hypothetical protein
MLILHRPFLRVAYRQGAQMSPLIDDTLQCALGIVQGARNIIQAFGWVSMNSSLAKHALLQSALILILDFFFRPARMDHCDLQDSLYFVVSKLKENSKHYTPHSLLYDAGNKLELLLSFVAKQRYLQSMQNGDNGGQDPTALDQLDAQLKQFGRVFWLLGETDSLLDESAMLYDAGGGNDVPAAQMDDFSESSGQRTEWERVWQDFFGALEMGASS